MSKWLLRGLVFAVLMVIVRLLQGALINLWESGALIISVTLVVLFAIAAFIWGLADGRGDARANPDPDRRGDLAMTRLLAGLCAVVHVRLRREPLRPGSAQRGDDVRRVHGIADVRLGDRGRRARSRPRR